MNRARIAGVSTYIAMMGKKYAESACIPLHSLMDIHGLTPRLHMASELRVSIPCGYPRIIWVGLGAVMMCAGMGLALIEFSSILPQ